MRMPFKGDTGLKWAIVRLVAAAGALAAAAGIAGALAPTEGKLERVYTAASREASLACGFAPTAVHAWSDSRSPRDYPPNNVSLGCSQIACRKPGSNPLEICVRDWAERNGYVYKGPPLCTGECQAFDEDRSEPPVTPRAPSPPPFRPNPKLRNFSR